MLCKAPGYPVILVNENDAEKPLMRVSEHLLILRSGCCLCFLAAYGFIGINAGNSQTVPFGVFRAGSDLRVNAGFVLPVR